MKKKLQEIINKVLGDRSIEDITKKNFLEIDLREDLNMDSLNLAHLTVLIEDEYGVDIFENGVVSNVLEIIEKINEQK
jgi:acyl carrier protein